MDQQHRYHEERPYGGVSDHLQPAWLCVPQIKVENEIGDGYRYQASPYNNIIHSVNSFMGFQHNPVESHSVPRKSGQPVNNPASDYCENRRSQNTSTLGNADFNGQTLPAVHPSNVGTSCHSLSVNSEDAPPRFRSSDQRNDGESACVEQKSNKSAWSGELADQCSSSTKQQFFNCGRSESSEGGILMNGENEDCESRQAFDLTCRSKRPSTEEEGSNEGSVVAASDMSSNPESQARCIPKPQTCKVCGKVLSSPSSYYVHMKLHSGNKPYACTMCEASFCRKPYLEVHMRTHTGERPFECGTCNKRFTQKSSLNTHKRVHTGERPYSCDICQKTFAVKSYVTAHRWSHVSEKPLACEHCDLTFTSRNLYAAHSRTHIDQNHECHICGRTFMKESYLIRHQNKVHRESNSTYSETTESRSSSQSPPAVGSPCPSIN